MAYELPFIPLYMYILEWFQTPALLIGGFRITGIIHYLDELIA